MAKETKTKSSTQTGKRTTKAKKDPAAPKRPLSAYMFFSQDHREKVKTENPDAGFGDVGRLLGAKWKEMSDSEKQPYLDMANRDKLRADAEKAAYNARHVAAHGARRA
ncbi:probable NHP6B - nonhistone chromosomal protein [Pseudozyma flocculosa]|uniref:Probable NHP6B - nonhistone chromosomal protein n=1 Tax=Pseudozyma flocculosa TaxID=84751 RepID=A0A5C3EY48_9BASI|nr:probable NHP6B - nonhistone chromosomal protein [Pseudozyma flocculosa]